MSTINTITVTSALKIKSYLTPQQISMAIVSTKAILIFAQFVLCYPVTRHIWKKYLEICEEIWHQMGSKRFDHKLKETVRQHFGQTKEYHNLRYTREVCNSKMKAKVGLTWACLNIKKWVKMMAGKPFYFALKSVLIKIPTHFEDSSAEYIKKTNTKMMFVFCLKEEVLYTLY